MKKCINKKALSILLSAILTVSVFATCLIFSATAADDPDAIKINNIGYRHETGFVQLIAGDGKTVNELTGKDLNAHRIIVVNKDNVVVRTYHLIGREPADGNSTNSGIKSDVVCPVGGYIIAIHDSLEIAGKLIQNQNTVADTVHPGDTIQLNNVNLDDVRAHNGLNNYVEVTDASFKVIPYDVDGKELPLFAINCSVKSETNSLIVHYMNTPDDPNGDAVGMGMQWVKFRKLKRIEGMKFEVADDFWVFGSKAGSLAEGEIYLTIACDGSANAANLAGNYAAYGLKKGDIVELDVSFTYEQMYKMDAWVFGQPNFGVEPGTAKFTRTSSEPTSEEPSTEPSSEEPSVEPSSEEPSEASSEEPSTEPSSEPASEASTSSEASTASTATSTAESNGESSVSAPQTSDVGFAAMVLLAIVTAGGVFAVRKFR